MLDGNYSRPCTASSLLLLLLAAAFTALGRDKVWFISIGRLRRPACGSSEELIFRQRYANRVAAPEILFMCFFDANLLLPVPFLIDRRNPPCIYVCVLVAPLAAARTDARSVVANDGARAVIDSISHNENETVWLAKSINTRAEVRSRKKQLRRLNWNENIAMQTRCRLEASAQRKSLLIYKRTAMRVLSMHPFLLRLGVLKPGAFPWAAAPHALYCAPEVVSVCITPKVYLFYKAINTLLEEFLLYSAALCAA